eukprot:NODE_3188_length_481_cov_88.259259_g2768_i0.p1 GENE.NODE_3188_length_481_cov_88.259259_g2768_i0~~NODE_3188_length_481_cov_88.259259_g2768_i0.p1  ORF type:complete len:118 (-),score=52.04 NODE_3188_length_481_cov_88.259259_g2768_i0:128-457(-)
MGEFAQGWDKTRENVVSLEEFLDYYSDVSAGVADDWAFEATLRNVWHVGGGEGDAANASCRKVLVTHLDGATTLETIQDDLGIGPNDLDLMRQNLEAQGINDIKKISLA